MRNGTTLTTASVLLLGLFFFALDARAQTVTGYTSIDYYDDTNVVDAYSETDEDYDVDSVYGAYVKLSVVDQNWNTMGFEYASDDGTYGYAAVEIQFYATPDMTYTATGMHKAYASQWDYNYENWPMVSIDYYDHYDFSFFENQNIFEPWSFSFLGPGFMVTRPTQPILLGATTDEADVQTASQKPGSLTILSIQTLPTGSGVDCGCAPNVDYGIQVAIKYQVNDKDGQPLQKANMIPQEKLTHVTHNGSNQADLAPNWIDVGPSPRNSQTSRFTNANGQFVDAPVGGCDSAFFTASLQQDLSIVVGSKRYTVRRNNIIFNGTTSGQGSISNDTDLQKSRP
jgi:hypothetical protein